MSNNPASRPLGALIVSFDRLRQPVKESDRRPGPFPYYGASGIVDKVDHYIFDGAYLLVAEDGENLRARKTPVAFMATGKFWVNNHAHVVQANSEADTRYLMYALRVSDVAAYLTGSTMPKLTAENLARIPIPFRPLPDQRAIADILGALDDKIELNRKITATLEAMARALFKSWFVDFDPVRAKAEGCDIGLSSEIASLFPSSFESSELGEIPAEWQLTSISNVALLSRSIVNPAAFPEELFDHYSIPAFDVGRVAIAETGRSIKSNKFLVPPNAVLLSRLNPGTPRVWMPHSNELRRAICSTEFAVMNLTVGSREWLYCLFCSDAFCQRFASMVTGTSGSHQRVKPESLLAMLTVKPKGRLLEVFTASVAPLLSRVAHNRDESATLGSLRDVLLPKLIFGELRVTDAARVLEKSA